MEINPYFLTFRHIHCIFCLPLCFCLNNQTSCVMLDKSSVSTTYYIIIIVSLLMSPLLGHQSFLLITHKENGP
jgi:hypothetical protein